jgi:hypothetical protein
MKKLSENWLTEDHIDLEYKQYVLLAWLEQINSQFNRVLIYPGLEELNSHYRNLCKFKESADSLYRAFPETMHQIDLINFRINYKKALENDSMMDELNQIISYSIPQFESQLAVGKTAYFNVEYKLHLEPVGLMPLSNESGYLLIEMHEPKEIRVFEYVLSLFDNDGENYRSVRTCPVRTYVRNLSNSPGNIKLDLIRENKRLPNPATFVMQSESPYSFDHTYFPIAKRMLMRALS